MDLYAKTTSLRRIPPISHLERTVINNAASERVVAGQFKGSGRDLPYSGKSGH
jgi:hypothetical protein